MYTIKTCTQFLIKLCLSPVCAFHIHLRILHEWRCCSHRNKTQICSKAEKDIFYIKLSRIFNKAHFWRHRWFVPTLSPESNQYIISPVSQGASSFLWPKQKWKPEEWSFSVAIFMWIRTCRYFTVHSHYTQYCSVLCHLLSHEALLMLPQICQSPRALWVGSRQHRWPPKYLLLQIHILGW